MGKMEKQDLATLLKNNIREIEKVENKKSKGLINEKDALEQIQKLRREYTSIMVDHIMD